MIFDILVIEDRAQRKLIISNTHDSNHYGINRTKDQISAKYYRPGMSKDIQLYVSTLYY